MVQLLSNIFYVTVVFMMTPTHCGCVVHSLRTNDCEIELQGDVIPIFSLSLFLLP